MRARALTLKALTLTLLRDYHCYALLLQKDAICLDSIMALVRIANNLVLAFDALQLDHQLAS